MLDKKIYIGFFILFLVLFISLNAFANNLSITNVQLKSHDPSANTAVIEFDISWDNSWNGDENHDAVWIFAKYKKTSDGTWNHINLKTSGTNPSDCDQGTGTGLTIDVPTDKKGCFLKRTLTGSGSVDTNDIQLTWDYGAIGDSIGIDEVKVFGIEMVYIPQGSFYFGDGDNSNESSNSIHSTSADNRAVLIGTSQVDNLANDSITYFSGIGGMSIDGDGTSITYWTGGSTGTNSSYPTGYYAYYCMKYEITQGQYRDFLNTLTRAQQNGRTEADVSADTITNVYVMSDSSSVTSGQGIRAPASGNGTTNAITFGCSVDGDATFDEANDGQWRAMNYLNWMDVAAFLDWSALRPMSELEYEKAARGPDKDAAYAYYAWGSTDLTQAEGAVQNAGTITEVANTTGPGLCNYNGAGTDTGVPLRVGFAATSATNRKLAGSSYWGVMELTGNVFDMVGAIDCGGSAGTANFNYQTHGDGSLASAGATTWNIIYPDYDYSVSWTSSSGGDNYACVTPGTEEPTAHSTSSYVYTSNQYDYDYYYCSGLDSLYDYYYNDNLSFTVTFWCYADADTSGNMEVGIVYDYGSSYDSLYISNSGPAWYSVTLTGPFISGMFDFYSTYSQIYIMNDSGYTTYVYAIYLEIPELESKAGCANVSGWPGYYEDTSTVVNAASVQRKGGSFNAASTYGPVSYREYQPYGIMETRSSDLGGRGVRTAPTLYQSY